MLMQSCAPTPTNHAQHSGKRHERRGSWDDLHVRPLLERERVEVADRSGLDVDPQLAVVLTASWVPDVSIGDDAARDGKFRAVLAVGGGGERTDVKSDRAWTAGVRGGG